MHLFLSSLFFLCPVSPCLHLPPSYYPFKHRPSFPVPLLISFLPINASVFIFPSCFPFTLSLSLSLLPFPNLCSFFPMQTHILLHLPAYALLRRSSFVISDPCDVFPSTTLLRRPANKTSRHRLNPSAPANTRGQEGQVRRHYSGVISVARLSGRPPDTCL